MCKKKEKTRTFPGPFLSAIVSETIFKSSSNLGSLSGRDLAIAFSSFAFSLIISDNSFSLSSSGISVTSSGENLPLRINESRSGSKPGRQLAACLSRVSIIKRMTIGSYSNSNISFLNNRMLSYNSFCSGVKST